MASKVVKQGKKKEVVKVVHDVLMKTTVRAQMATAAPPLGPMLGERGYNVANFCKHFNKETSHVKPGVPLPTRLTQRPDRSYDMEICTPSTSWLLTRAAGIRRGAEMGDVAGMLSVKHLYEIAVVKSRDKALYGMDLKDVCRMMVTNCRLMGIAVQKEDLDVNQLQSFLDSRRTIVADQLKAWADKKAAKMQRTAV